MTSGQFSARHEEGILAILMGLVLVGLVGGCGNPVRSESAPSTTIASATAPVGHALPVAIQSDAAMRAAGNQGPSSSILVPSSCTVTASSATATGTYRDGFAPEVYARYGDVVDLYIFSAPQSGYPEGIQLARPFTRHAPTVSGRGPWSVTVPLQTSLSNVDQPDRCLVAAQPTHEFEGAPSAY